MPNTEHDFLQDFAVIRARTFIKKGEEVFISYLPVGHGHAERQEFFAPIFEKGICPCKVCELDRLDGKEKVALRHKILEEELLPHRQRSQLGVPPSDEEGAKANGELLPILARLESTYSSSRGSLRPELSDIYHRISTNSAPTPIHLRQEAVDYRLKGFESAGAKFERKGTEIKVVVPPVQVRTHLDPVALCLLTSCTYLQVLPKDTAACLSWIQAAVDMEKLLRQGTFASVRQRHSGLLKSLKIVTLYNEAEKLSLRRKQ